MKKLLTILFLLLVTTFSNAQVAVIANNTVPIETITESQLLDIYSGDVKWWDNGSPVIVFDLAEKTDIKSTFYKYIGKSTARMKSIWLKNMLSGEGEPPKAMDSEEEMLQRVLETIGAIGFIGKDKVSSDVKVLAFIE